MDKLPAFGRGISEVILPTFGAYEGLLKAKEEDIRSVQRETHNYGPNPRHVLDLYIPDNQQQSSSSAKSTSPTTTTTTRKTVLVFLHGGGFFAGARVNEGFAGGLIFGNIGRYFTSKHGVTVIVPDYRLLSHGARYPSGGEDVSLVVDWVRESLARREGYRDETIDLVLLGNSAGGVHVATYLLDPAFGAAREHVLEGAGRVSLRGAIFLGAPFHWGDNHDENIRAYLGEDTVFENSPLGKLQAAGHGFRLPGVKVLILLSELDPELLFETAEEFRRAWEGQQESIMVQVLEGHNHISPQLSLGTGIEREEAWGQQVAVFLNSCASG